MHMIYECSDIAKQYIDPQFLGAGQIVNNYCGRTGLYIFGRLLIGQSFGVSFSQTSKHNLQMAAYQYGKRNGISLKVIEHKNNSVYEVVRLVDKTSFKKIKKTEFINHVNESEWNKTIENLDGYKKPVYKIFSYDEITERARSFVEAGTENGGNFEFNKKYRKYPFCRMLIGQSFFVLDSENLSRGSIESAHRNYSKNDQSAFRVIRHKEQQCYEIVRIK